MLIIDEPGFNLGADHNAAKIAWAQMAMDKMNENMDGRLRNEPQLCEKPSENRVPNWHILRLHLICKACYLAQLGPCVLLFAIYPHVGPCGAL